MRKIVTKPQYPSIGRWRSAPYCSLVSREQELRMNALLYLLTWMSWGGSWLAIKWQEGSVPVQQSIAYRFALAGLILMLALVVFRKLQATMLRDHMYFLLQGGCLFSLNFVAFYNATYFISSGLVAVVMSTVILMNAFLAKLIWQQAPSQYLKFGAPLGMAGLVLVFWQDMTSGNPDSSTLIGVGCALTGSLFFSLGNMVSIRQSRAGIDTLTSNGWSMLYGCTLMLIINGILREPLVFDSSVQYVGGLIYLALIASVLAFPTYLMLVKRIGASSAAYVLVATPILALALSSWFEAYQWSLPGVIGVGIIILGNVVVLAPVSFITRILARLGSSNQTGSQG